MIRIGIIAGGGELPLLVGKQLIKKNFSVTFFVIKEFFNEEFYSNYETVKINLNSLKFSHVLTYPSDYEKNWVLNLRNLHNDYILHIHLFFQNNQKGSFELKLKLY